MELIYGDFEIITGDHGILELLLHENHLKLKILDDLVFVLLNIVEGQLILFFKVI